jgi:hypothetical protein
MVSKLKRPLIEWEKIFSSYPSNKGLITLIYRELKKLNSPKINEPIKKWANELNRTFSKEEIQMSKKHMKKFSLSLAIKEMQLKTTLRFHLTPVKIAIIKNTTNKRCWPLLRIYSKECDTGYSKDTCTPTLIEALFTWKQPSCPTVNEWIK